CDTAPTDIYTLSLHDALPISPTVQGKIGRHQQNVADLPVMELRGFKVTPFQIGLFPRQNEIQYRRVRLEDRFARLLPQIAVDLRSEEHTSELQSRENLVCRLL